MRSILLLFSLWLAGIGVSAAQTQPASAPKDWLEQWQAATKQLLEVADAMPAEKYSYKPVAEVNSFGDQIKHTIQAMRVLLGNAQGQKVDLQAVSAELGKLTAKAEIIAELRKTIEAGTKTVKEVAGKNDGEVVDSQFFGKTTRRYLILQAIAHDQNHYGQLVFYLRLNGIVPPASRR